MKTAEKNRFDGAMRIADFATGRWDARRSHEAKLTFAIWAVLVGAIVGIRADHFPWLVGVMLVAVHGLWLKESHTRNCMDRDIAWNSVRAADEVLGLQLVPDKPSDLESPVEKSIYSGWFDFLNDWSARVKMAFTVVLVLLFYLLCVGHPLTWFFWGVEIARP